MLLNGTAFTWDGEAEQYVAAFTALADIAVTPGPAAGLQAEDALGTWHDCDELEVPDPENPRELVAYWYDLADTFGTSPRWRVIAPPGNTNPYLTIQSGQFP